MPDGAVMNILLSFGLVAACLTAILLVIKKFSKTSAKESGSVELQVLARKSLLPKVHLFVVKAGTRTLLIGASEHNISTLGDLSQVNTAAKETTYRQVGNSGTGIPAAEKRIGTQSLSKVIKPETLSEDTSFKAYLKSRFSRSKY